MSKEGVKGKTNIRIEIARIEIRNRQQEFKGTFITGRR